ncbi:hypothetical protein DIPPA_07580 [Diplonema papillatum]|nr:hypothetical protein DIPPA_07580 [Diplonema papillatum]
MAAVPSTAGVDRLFRRAHRRLESRHRNVNERLARGQHEAAQWLVGVVKGSTLGVLVPDRVVEAVTRDEDEDDDLSTTNAACTIALHLAAAVTSSALDTASWVVLTKALTKAVGNRELVVPLLSWTCQSVMREIGQDGLSSYFFDARHCLRHSLTQKLSRASWQTCLDVSKNTASLLSVTYGAPWVLGHSPALQQAPRRVLFMVTQALLPFTAMTVAEGVLQRRLPPVSSTLSNFVFFAAVQSVVSPAAKPADGPDSYRVMGIPASSSVEDIQRRYRTVALALHPDNAAHANAKEILGEYAFPDFTRAYNDLMAKRGGRGR